jgi:hypothetical protein
MEPEKKTAYEEIIDELQIFRTRRGGERQANVRACPYCEGLVEIVLADKRERPVVPELSHPVIRTR